MEQILERHRGTKISVFVVWEPILPSDFMAPATSVLRRVSDPRARHYWDRHHVLAKRMKQDARAPQPAPSCCEQEGILWDLAAVYPKGARWEETLPPALLFDGPVVRIVEPIEAALLRGDPGVKSRPGPKNPLYL